MVTITNNIKELQRQRDEELGGQLENLEVELADKEKSAMKTEATMKAVQDNIKQEERKKNQIIKGMNTDKKALDEKQKQFDGVQGMYEKLKEENDTAIESLKNAQVNIPLNIYHTHYKKRKKKKNQS